jgi:hypothetical protein
MENKTHHIINTELSVKQIGTSYYLLLNKEIKDRIEIKPGIVLKVSLENIENQKVKCPRCQNEFYCSENDEVVDCNICDAEITEAEKKVVKE